MIYGIVMAAGLSTRMGAEKLMLPLRGSSILETTLSRAAEVCDGVVVVTKPFYAGRIELPGNAVEVMNPQPSLGQASSISVAMRWIADNAPETESILFFPADMPNFDMEAARSIRARAEGHPESIVVARCEARIYNPCAFGSKWFEELMGLTGDVGGRQVIRRHPEAVVYEDFDEPIGKDIDTFPDYLETVVGNRNLVIVRGAGDIATGTIYRLHQSGYPVIALDVAQPTVIRRTVSFAQAIFDGETTVEGVRAVRSETLFDIATALEAGDVPVVVDPAGSWIQRLRPAAVVDAILAKKNMGTTMNMAPVVVAVGPGFTAGEDCHAVVETKRGHTLGRVIYEGSAIANTGIPGMIGGYAEERVIHAPAAGVIHPLRHIADHVEQGECIALIGDVEVKATISGVLRGMICDGMEVQKGLKMADIDPRDVTKNCWSISDKALAVAGGAQEAVSHLIAEERRRKAAW